MVMWALLTCTCMTSLSAPTPTPVKFGEHALRPAALQRLNAGQTKPAGWLKDELTLQAKGLSGQLPYFWSYINRSSWMGGSESGEGSQSQFMGYYLQGLVPLSYQVEDTNLADIRERYIRYILDHQDSSGYLGTPIGPANSTANAETYWAKYDMIQALEFYAEANTSAMREVKSALMRHHEAFYKSLSSDSPALELSRWGVARYSDGIVGIQWLLDHGEGSSAETAWLWDLQRILRTRADELMSADDHSWENWFAGDPGFITGSTSPFNYTKNNQSDPTGWVHLLRHGVDIGQAMKTGPLWWRVDGLEYDENNTAAALEWAAAYLRRADGMYWADEEVSGESSPSRGTETCSIVETMFSMRTAYEITGNISFMDRLEQIAFNSLPAALWPDATANVYHHANNQVDASAAPYAYDLYFCCSANVHQGWPKFMLSSVHTQNEKIVISGYAPTTTTLTDGTTIHVNGTYPFSDNVSISVSRGAQIRLRIPCWTNDDIGAHIVVGDQEPKASQSCTWMDLTTNSAATIKVFFYNKVRLPVWVKSNLPGQSTINNGAIEVHRGALLYAFRPQSTIVNSTASGGVQPYPASLPHNENGWPTVASHKVTIKENATWNYGLLPSSLEFEETGVELTSTPFSTTSIPPVRIRVKAQVVPEWTRQGGARGIAPPPESPLPSKMGIEDIELVPYGATNIRVSVFPQLCQSTEPHCPSKHNDKL